MLRKEQEADRFAGCAASVMGASWENVKDLFSRLRLEVATNYPNREQSLLIAKAGFDDCQRTPPVKLNCSNENGDKLLKACDEGRTSDVKAMLESNPSCINYQDYI